MLRFSPKYSRRQFAAAGCEFDGTSVYALRAGGIAGAVDSKQGIFSGWFRMDANSKEILSAGGGLFGISYNSSNQFFFFLKSTSGSTLSLAMTSSAVSPSATWRHILAVWDVGAGSAACQIQLDGVSSRTVAIINNLNIDYTTAGMGLGARYDLGISNYWNGGMAEVYLALGKWLDLGIAANPLKYRTAAGKPADLGIRGAAPTGSIPEIYFRIPPGAPATDFAQNLGTGGSFTFTGTPTISPTSP